MDNRISLQEYLTSFRTVEEKRQVFYAIFEEMHRFHNNGEYILNLSYKSVSVCFTNPADIHFAHYQKIGNRPMQEVLDIKFQNILKLSQMMICSFLDCDCFTSLVCISVLIEKLSTLKSVLHQIDYAYYERVLLEKEFLYYDDYIRGYGKDHYPPFKEKRLISEKEQAFTSYLLLIINLLVVLMIFSCMFLYLS